MKDESVMALPGNDVVVGTPEEIAPQEYARHLLQYRLDQGRLTHNVSRDFACFAIWKDARGVEDRIREYLHAHFEVLADVEIVWSEAHFLRNATRLYENPVDPRMSDSRQRRRFNDKIGARSFRFLVLEDRAPYYVYARAVSGRIEPSNRRIVEAKNLFRSWVPKRYRVHSSNHIEEFFVQATLILGPDVLRPLLDGVPFEADELEKDMEGAQGWRDWTHLFETLRWCSDYLVLRNFESLPQRLADADIDLLCTDFQRLASAANVAQRVKENRPYKGHLQVGGESYPVDIRFVGDGTFDACWQQRVLSQKIAAGPLFVPRADDYFFSLLYHAVVHKPHVKEAYVERFRELATSLELDWFHPEELLQSEKSAAMLTGYMTANGYRYVEPLDPGVGRNRTVIKRLPGGKKWHPSLAKRIWTTYLRRRLTPPKKIRKLFRKLTKP